MRQTVSFLLIIPLVAGLAARAQEPAKGPVRPADEIPLARLKADATLALALTPGSVAAEKALWIATPAGPVSVDAATNAVSSPVPLPGAPCASLAWGLKALWVPQCAARTVARVDEASRAVTTASVPVADPAGSIAAGVGSVWVASDASGVVSRLDPDTREVVAEVFVGREPAGVVFAEDMLWITSAAANTVTRVEPHTNTVVETVPVGHGVGTGDIATGAGAVWLSAPGSPLVRIDPATNRVVQRFTGPGGGAVTVAHGSVWVAAGSAVTWRLDPALVMAMRP